MPCINSTSLGEPGGSVARVDAGSVLVGCPGAPGCTTTGALDSFCWAQTGSADRQVSIPIVISKFGRLTSFTTDACRKLARRANDFIGLVKFARRPYHRDDESLTGERHAKNIT